MNISISVPVNFNVPKELQTNDAEYNADIITLGIMNKKLQEKMVMDQQTNKFYNDTFIKHLENSLEIERKRNNDLLKEFNTINDFAKRYKTTVNIGDFGENFVEEYIQKHFITSHSFPKLENVSSIKGYGDLHFIDNRLKLLIEVKNIQDMTKKDLNKFHDNVKDCYKNNIINAGLFISLNDTNLINGKKGIVLDFLKTKVKNKFEEVPVIYISNVLQNHDIIRIAINFLGYIIEKGNKTDNSSYKLQLEEISSKVQQMKTIIEKNKKCIETLKEQNNSLEEIINNLNVTY